MTDQQRVEQEWFDSPATLCCLVNPCGNLYGRRICRDCLIHLSSRLKFGLSWKNFVLQEAVIISSQKAT